MTDASTPGPSGPETVLYEGRPAIFVSIWAYVLAVFTLGISILVYWLQSRGRYYRITSQRIVTESGVLSKQMHQLDLYRITDFVVERPFAQRLAGTGNLVVQAMEQSASQLRIEGIKVDVVALYEKLRIATEAQKRAHGVRVVDYG
jgi:uncharacterized membrane protein YdbT with pleckstrin-like domain